MSSNFVHSPCILPFPQAVVLPLTSTAITKMRLAPAFALFADLRFAIGAALWPTILAVWQAPSLIFQPQALSRLFMSHVWNLFGNGVDANGRDVKQVLITPHAYGVVLDLGAGESLPLY
jgi:fatty acid desaturase